MTIVDFFHTVSTWQTSPDKKGMFVIQSHLPVRAGVLQSAIIQQLKKILPQMQTIDVANQDMALSKGMLETSFLGGCLWYILKDFDLLDAKSKKVWYAYLAAYPGPHMVLFFDSAKEKIVSSVIELPENVDLQFYQQLYALFYPDYQMNQQFIKALERKKNSYFFDEVFLLMAYQSSVGKAVPLFFNQWFDQIIHKESSLFDLSQQFFALQSLQFWQLWSTLKPLYPEEFWVVYWSDQLWYATQFIFKAEQNYFLAKKSAVRLPFSFINKHWKLHAPQDLIAAHDALYRIDHRMKNGGDGMLALELWYHQFFK